VYYNARYLAADLVAVTALVAAAVVAISAAVS